MFNLRFAKDFLSHRFKAKNRHGLHSPFVYTLVDKIIYDFNSKKVYTDIEKIRKELQSASQEGHTFKSARVDQLIYRLVANLKPCHILQIAHTHPVTALYIQKAATDAESYTLNEEPGKFKGPENFDLILINADTKEHTLKYFEWSLTRVHENTMLIFDDIYKDEDRKQAWAAIKANPKVTVTVDLFWIGLIFFRRGQIREDFMIRY